MTDSFPAIRFRGELRPSQQDVVAIARRKLAEGKRRLHIVAPPGSGKTVLGLYLWAECVRRPALVITARLQRTPREQPPSNDLESALFEDAN